jgi:hypothetical protein
LGKGKEEEEDNDELSNSYCPLSSSIGRFLDNNPNDFFLWRKTR